jgi:cytochrome c556
MRKRLIVISGALFALAAAGLPQAGEPKDDGRSVSGLDAIAARQAGMDMSVIVFRSMGDGIKAGSDAKNQAFAAAGLAKWANAVPHLFPAGTGKGETSTATQALPTIWQDRAGFDHAAAYYAETTVRLAALAADNDTTGFTKQLDVVNQACGACHAAYKQAVPHHHGN